MIRYHNPKYAGSPSIPVAVGDRFYGQDLFRNFRHLKSMDGEIWKKIIGHEKAIIEGLEVNQGTGHTLNITAGKCIGTYQVTIPHPTNAWALPPDTDTEDITVLMEVLSDINNMAITGATTDGITVNYVKIAYTETDGNTRQRAKKAGTYAYEVIPSYTITVNSTAPTIYETLLETFTSNGSTITFLGNENIRVNNDISNQNPKVKYPVKSGESFSLNEWVSLDKNGELLETNDDFETEITAGATGVSASDTRGELHKLSNGNLLGVYRSTSGALSFMIWDTAGSVVKTQVVIANSSAYATYRETVVIILNQSNQFVISWTNTSTTYLNFNIYDNSGTLQAGPVVNTDVVIADHPRLTGGEFSNGNFYICYKSTASNTRLQSYNSLGVAQIGPIVVGPDVGGISTIYNDMVFVVSINGSNDTLWYLFNSSLSLQDSGSEKPYYSAAGNSLFPGTFVGYDYATEMYQCWQYKDHIIIACVTITSNAGSEYFHQGLLFRLKPSTETNTNGFPNADVFQWAKLWDSTGSPSALIKSFPIPSVNFTQMNDKRHMFVSSGRGDINVCFSAGSYILDLESFKVKQILPKFNENQGNNIDWYQEVGNLGIASFVENSTTHAINLKIRHRNIPLGMVVKLISTTHALIDIGKIIDTGRNDLIINKPYYINNGVLTDALTGAFRRAGTAITKRHIMRENWIYGSVMDYSNY